MLKRIAATILALSVAGSVQGTEHEHYPHPVPEKLGSVNFATSCASSVKPAFERAVALLHSFAYSASEQAFRDVAAKINVRNRLREWRCRISTSFGNRPRAMNCAPRLCRFAKPSTFEPAHA